jgi:hypothetical protein
MLIPNIRQIKSKRMRYTGHVTSMREESKVYRVLVGKPEGRRPRHRWDQIGSWGDWLGGDSFGSG